MKNNLMKHLQDSINTKAQTIFQKRLQAKFRNSNLIILTESEFQFVQKFGDINQKYFKCSKIKHPYLTNTYFYNGHQFAYELEIGLIKNTDLSEENLKKMQQQLQFYNTSIPKNFPKAIGLFKTQSNTNIVLRSDIKILEEYNKKCKNDKSAFLIYFTQLNQRVIVLKDTSNNTLINVKRHKEQLPTNGIRIFKTSFLRNQNLISRLTKIYGLGGYRSRLILRNKGLALSYKIKNDSLFLIKEIEKELRSNDTVGLPLRKTVWDNLSKLFKSPTYRGTRHRNNLPVRGQRTRTNARTRKRNRKKEYNQAKKPQIKNVKKKK